MSNSINIVRGQNVRRALLAVIRLAYAQGAPLPRQTALADLVGVDRSRVYWHLRHLRTEGAFVPHHARRRTYVREVRP